MYERDAGRHSPLVHLKNSDHRPGVKAAVSRMPKGIQSHHFTPEYRIREFDAARQGNLSDRGGRQGKDEHGDQSQESYT